MQPTHSKYSTEPAFSQKIAGLETTASHFWGFADTWCSGKDTVMSCESLPWLALGWPLSGQADTRLGANPEFREEPEKRI